MGTSVYPVVADEFATLRKLAKGKSIARFGDGELKLLEGGEYVREPRNHALTYELRMVVKRRNPDCLVAIPTMDPSGPKASNWSRHEARFCRYFWEGDGRRYYSAFISRPDSAPAIESAEYVEEMVALWSRRRVAVVAEADSKLLACARRTAGDVFHVECPHERAYAAIDALERAVVAADVSLALLSCGPTATCLANRLATRGVQGLDLGSIGGLLCRWKNCDVH